jgi:ADP-heptose:LPS heptosyltransferase
MAGAVGTPCISLFSARDMPNKWYPHGSRNLVLRKWVDCHTCLTEKCPYDNLCMNMITVDEVIEAIDAKVSHWREPVQSTG